MILWSHYMFIKSPYFSHQLDFMCSFFENMYSTSIVIACKCSCSSPDKSIAKKPAILCAICRTSSAPSVGQRGGFLPQGSLTDHRCCCAKATIYWATSSYWSPDGRKIRQFFGGHEIQNTLPENSQHFAHQSRAWFLPQKESFIGTKHQFFEGLPAC